MSQRPKTAPVYNYFSPPPSPGPGEDPRPPPDDELVADPRHKSNTPWPWLRYFMPKDFEVREGATGNVFYQYFDVRPSDLQEDLSVPPPKWCPAAYHRLSFTQVNVQPGQAVKVKAPGDKHTAEDAIKGSVPIFAEGNEFVFKEVKSFCQSVASFSARTWRDAFPLVDLLRGVVLYLVGQMEAGQALAVEYARREMLVLVEKEKQRMADEMEARLQAMRAEIEAEAEERIAHSTDETRRKLQEETLAQLRAEKDENARLSKSLAMAEQNVKKLTETVHLLQRQLESQNAESEAERRDAKHALLDKERELTESKAATAAWQEALLRTRQAVLDALRARTKQEVMAVACAAVGAALPGTHAYVAELRDVLPPEMAAQVAQTTAEELMQLKKQSRYLAGVVDPSLPPFTPGFLSVPQALGDLAHVDPGANPEEPQQPALLLKYVQASPDHAFMLGQSLPAGQGVSWDILQHKEVFVQDIGANKIVKHFRSPPAGTRHVSYLALPLTGHNGEVLGMLAADGVSPTSETDKQFVRDLAVVVQQALIRDQEALARLRAMAAEEVEEPVLLHQSIWVDPAPYADMEGGLPAWEQALAGLRALGAKDLDELKARDLPDETTLAVLRAVLGSMGMADGSTGWDVLRSRITPDLIARLSKLSHDDAWSAWETLCGHLKPVLALETAGVDIKTSPRTPVGKALALWTSAICKISAARAVRKVLEERLQRANQKLMSTFSEGGSALVELRSYRVPPKHTMAVLQMCWTLVGVGEDDRQNWGKMRVQTNYKMIKLLTAVKTRDLPAGALTSVFSQLRTMNEADVKQESLAALTLWRWLTQFQALAAMELQHAKLKVL